MRKTVTSTPLRFMGCLALSTIIVSFLLPVAAASGQASLFVPGNDRGLFVVEDVLSQFTAIKHHGEAIGWINPEDQGAIDPSIYDHYQGLSRYPGEGVPVFYVTQKDDDDDGKEGGYLHVVRFGSRPMTGERLRSNVQMIGNDTEEAYPPSVDTWVRSIRFDGSFQIDGMTLPAYVHPGSMAIVDDILFVPLDTPESGGDPTGQIVLFDLQNDPENPTPIQAMQLSHQIDNLAVTEQDDGSYLVWVNGDGGNAIKFYKTSGSDLRDNGLGLIEVQDWNPGSGLLAGSWPTGACAHQSSTFLREPDGTLFLICMRHAGICWSPSVGSDWADLYQVDEPEAGLFTLTEIHSHHLYCVYDGGGGSVDMRICNFAAANNAYVSPSGELILYSIPHDDEDGFDPDIVRLAEFRHRDVNREGSPLRVPTAECGGPFTVDEGGTVGLIGIGEPPADRPWVELYDDDHFNDRSIVVDYDDRHLLEINNFNHLDGFNDKTTSIRWRMPVGLDIEVFDDDNFSDRYIVLRGTGLTESIAHVDPQVVVPGVVEHYNPYKDVGESLDFNDKTSSMRFIGAPPAPGSITLEWDLDGDDWFGETGAGAMRGDEVGETPIFDATYLDGPTQVTVTLHANAAGVSGTGTDFAVIDVANVAPVVWVDSLSGGIGGIALIAVPVILTGSYNDISADTHTASVDWDDGNNSPASVNDAADVVTASHTYSSAGDLTIELTVTDDDGGSGSATKQLTVYDPDAAVDASIDRIDELLTMVSDPEAEAALWSARNWLDGNKEGRANNGAIDKLESDDYVAGLVMIIKALKALEEAEAADGSDLSTEKLLLALAAQSVAQAALDDAEAALGPSPTPDQQLALTGIEGFIADGVAQLAVPNYIAAVEAYKSATARAVGLLP
jgi:PKD repeat protein